MTALLSFLGGNAFRLLFGEIASYFTRKQEAALEMKRMEMQEKLDAAQHDRNLAAIKVQAEMGVKTIEIQRDADVARVEVDGWLEAVRAVGKASGIRWVDAWNAAIRPWLATFASVVVVAEIVAAGFVLTEWHQGIVAAILGVYVADRNLSKRGK